MSHVDGSASDDKTLDAVFHAIDISLAAHDDAGKTECLRCGHRWRPRRPDPATCPMCHSAYWNRLPVTKRGRRPADVNLQRLRKARSRERRDYRRLYRLKKTAKKLGLTLVDPRTGELPPEMTVKREPTTATPAATTTKVDAPKVEQWVRSTPPAEIRRTVPPPPGLEDL